MDRKKETQGMVEEGELNVNNKTQRLVKYVQIGREERYTSIVKDMIKDIKLSEEEKWCIMTLCLRKESLTKVDIAKLIASYLATRQIM